MKVEKNNNSIFRNKHVLVVVAVMCIFTIIACMGFMLSVPAHAEENIAPNTEPIAFSTPIETVNELDKAFPITETSEEAHEEITTAEVESSDAAEPKPRIETAEAAIEEAERNPKQFQIISTTMSLKSTQLCGPLAFQRPVLPQ